MVGIVAGQGLGLFNTSLGLLGSQGVLGSAGQGRSGEKVYVNASNGNLVVQQQDEWLVGVGPDAGILRTYNSQGGGTDDNGDNWRLGLSRRIVGFTGTVNTVGSTVKRVGEDGAEVLYTWDASRSLYINKDGAGSFDTLSYANGTWSWTDGGTQVKESYAVVSGTDAKLMRVVDPDGNAVELTYGGGLSSYLVTEINTWSATAATGEKVKIVYDTTTGNTNDILSITTSYLTNGVAQPDVKRVSYTYETYNTNLRRLKTVTVDLTPQNVADNAVVGTTYVTTYTYVDATSKRLASITQADGSKLDFGYDAAFRVNSVKESVGAQVRETRFDYSVAGVTKVTDALGQLTELSYEATAGQNQGQLKSIKAPTVGGQTLLQVFEYDANGNVSRIVDARGNATVLTYDANGNRTYERDAQNNVVRRTFSPTNQLLTQISYTDLDPDGAGAGEPTAALTTRYVYETAVGKTHQLRFVISSEGRVTENTYNSTGQVARMVQYASNAYPVGALGVAQTPTLADLVTWAGSQLKSNWQRVDQVYNSRGQLDKQTTYASVDASGNGITADNSHSVTQYVYDQAGNLLQKIDGNNKTTQYAYDGLNRVISQTDALGNVATTVYTDSTRNTAVTFANGLLVTSTYDAAGQLISVVRSDGAVALGTSTYVHDALGRLRTTISPTGEKVYALYDAASRQTAIVDAEGALTEYIYNANDQVVRTVRYANKVDAAKLVGDGTGLILDGASGIRPVASVGADRVSRSVYDKAGRLAMSIDALGAVVAYRHDGAGRQLDTIKYASTLTSAQLAALATATSELSISPSGALTITSATGSRTLTWGGSAWALSSEASWSQLATSGQVFKQSTVPTAGAVGDAWIDTGSTNRFANSENLSAWSSSVNRVTVQENWSVAPDGKGTGDFMFEGSATGDHYVDRNEAYDGPGVYTLSDHFMGYGRNAFLAMYSNGNNHAAWFNFSTGVATLLTPSSGVTAGMSYVGSGWWRCWITANITDATTPVQRIGLADSTGQTSYTGDGIHGVHSWGSQLEKSAAPGRYIPTTSTSSSTVGSNETQVWNGALWQPSGNQVYKQTTVPVASAVGDLWVDGGSSNLLSWSDDWSRTTAWSRTSSATVPTTNVLAPDGSQTASRVILTSDDNARVDQALPVAAVAGQTRTYSVWLRGSGTCRIAVNTTTGVGGSGERLITLTSTWTRYSVSVTYAANVTGNVRVHGVIVRAGDTARDVEVWHAQLEPQASAGLNIKTEGAAVSTTGSQRVLRWSGTSWELPDQGIQNRRTRSFYNPDGLLVGQLDAEGRYTAHAYDAAGRLSKTTRYANAMVGALPDGNVPPSVVSAAVGSAYVLSHPANDQITQSLYNNRGQFIGEIDAEGYYTAHRYDRAGNRVGTTSYLNKLAGTFDGVTPPVVVPINGTVPSSGSYVLAHAEDQKTTNTYDGNNRLTQTDRQPAGVVSTYAYDSMGNLVKSVNALGQPEERTQQQRYDKLGRLTAELGGEGSKALAQLLASTPGASQAQIDAIWASHGLQHQYDLSGRRVATIEPNGSDAAGIKTVYYYDKVGRLTHSINALGAVVQYDYNSFGERLTQTQVGTLVASPSALSGGLAASLGTTVSSLLNMAKDSKTSIAYDQRGLVTNLTDALGFVSTRQYNAFGELLSRVDRQTASTTAQTLYSYNRVGQLLNSQEVTLGRSTSQAYDAFGRLISQVDGNGKVTTTSFDRLGRQVQVTDPTGAIRRQTYDAFSRSLSQTDALGNLTTFSHDTANRRVTVTTAENIQTITESNRHGQTVKVTDGRGNATTYNYNADGHLLSTVAPASLGTVSISYDKAGRVYETSDARGTVTRTTYDAASRVLTRVQDPTGLNLSTQYRYDAKGQAIWSRDASGVWTQTEYDLKGQVTAVVVDPKRGPDWATGAADDNPAGLALRTQYTFDAQGRTLSVIEGAGTAQAKTTQYEYDAGGRRTKEIADPAGLKLSSSYTYDANNNVTSRKDAKGQITSHVYDADNRPIYVVDATGAVTKNEYDAEGRLSRSTAYATRVTVAAVINEAYVLARLVPVAANDQVTRLVYDKDGRQTHRIDPLGHVTRVEYDATGNVVKRTRYATAVSSVPVAAQAGALISWGSPVVGASALDRVEQTSYDVLGRATYSVDAMGYVTQRSFDANGNVTKLTRYANVMQGSLLSNATPVVTADGALDQTTHTVYDKANRATHSVDAQNYVTTTSYDALGRVSSQTRHGTALASYVVGTVPAVTVNALLDATTSHEYDKAGRILKVIDPLGTVTYNVYDAANRVTDNTVAWGTADAATTHYNYDAAGRVTQQISGYGKAEQASTNYGLDALGQRTSVTTAGYTTQQEFDAAGRVTKTTSPLTWTTSAEYDAFGNAVKVTDPNGNVGYFYFDQGNRATWQVDPEGYAVFTKFDGLGQVEEITRFDAKVMGTPSTAKAPLAYATQAEATAAGATLYVIKDVAKDAISKIGHDKLGRQTSLTDAENKTESMAYDGLGNKTSYTNKLGGTYTYTHDRLGRVLTEKAPVLNVTTRFGYDARGNVTQKTEAELLTEQRITTYTYDLLNRLRTTTGEAMATYTVAGGDKNETPVETRTYDRRGNLIELKAADGARTLAYWDAHNRKVGELSPTGTLSYWSYADDGKTTAQRVYADPIALPATPGGERPAPSNANNVRKTLYLYDGNRRLIETQVENVTVGQRGTNGAYSVTTGTVKTFKAYDKAGNLVKETDALGNETFNYHDKLGNRTLQVDAERFVTQWTYDDAGNVLSQTRYANAIPLATVVGTSSTPASLLAAIPTASDKRVVEYSYDRLGRKLEERTLNVLYTEVNSASGTPTEKTGTVTIKYEYNALGAVTRQTDATSQVTDMEYDLQGRLVKTLSPGFVDWEGSTVRPTTQVEYNGLGLERRTIQRGKNDASESDDRITTYTYGKNGVRTSETDAMGNVTSYAYDVAARVTRRDISRKDAAGVSSDDRLSVRYDLAGRQVEQITASKLASVGTYTQLKTEQTGYSAYGEVISQGENGGAQRQIEYDTAGRVWRSNATDSGAATVYYYDANGNATLELTSSTHDLSSSAVLADRSAASLSGVLSANLANPKFNVYDKLNRLIDSYEPRMTGTAEAASIKSRVETVTLNIPQDPFITGGVAIVGGAWGTKLSGSTPVLVSKNKLSSDTSVPIKVVEFGTFVDPRYGFTALPVVREFLPEPVWNGSEYEYFQKKYYSTTAADREYFNSQAAVFQDRQGGRVVVAVSPGTIFGWPRVDGGVRNHSVEAKTSLTINGLPNNAVAVVRLYLRSSSDVSAQWFSVSVLKTKIYDADAFFANLIGCSGVFDFKYEMLDPQGVKIAGAHGSLNANSIRSTIDLLLNDERPDIASVTYVNYLDWQLSAAIAFDLSVHRRQVYDAYGDIIRQIRYKREGDALVEVATELSYNAQGKLIEKKDPSVSITLENGFQKQVSPTTRYHYDSMGRLVGVKDANGNTNTMALLAGSPSAQPIVVAEYHADRRLVDLGSSNFVAREGVKRSQYDVFGQLRRSTNENWDGVAAADPYATTYGYNNNGHLTSINRPGAADETYEVDSLGNRIATTLAPSATDSGTRYRETTSYDALGRVLKTVTAFGRSTSYTYDWVAAIAGGGGWRRTTTTADGTLIDDTDVFNRIRWHKDLGNHAFSYRYNSAGLLSWQTSLAADGAPANLTQASPAALVYTGQNISFAYYGNGLLKDTTDNARQTWTKYRYDDSGNRTFEGYARNYGTSASPSWEYYQYSEASYDDAGRLVRIWDPKSDIKYEYDAMGNRRRVHSTYHDGAQGGLQTQDYWYAYDYMNRFTVTMGSLNSTNGNTRATTEGDAAIRVVQGANGRLIGYDHASQRKSAVTARGTESYTYDAEGYLQEVLLNSARIAWRDNDARGNVMVMEETGTDGVTRHAYTYDADNNVTLDRQELRKTNEVSFKLTANTVNTLLTSGAITKVVRQEYKDDGAVNNTVTTDYSYTKWDDAKQSEIAIRATSPSVSRYWEPGSTTLSYDINGHVERSYDRAGNRHFYYGTDADGRVIRREEVDGPDVKPSIQNNVAAQRSALYYQNYYFFNGREVGTVSNDPNAGLKDYAQALSQAKQEAYYKRNAVVSADFDQNYQPIGTDYPGRTGSNYTVARTGETLQNIALAVWGDASLWYLIADANGLTSASQLAQGQRLVIPNKVTNLHNNTQTSRPYDASQALGNITPTLPDPPPPPDKGCGGLLQILVIAVAIAVTAGVGGMLAGSMSNVAAYAIGGAVGSIASQGVAIATGLQEKFSWKSVAIGAIGGAISGGLMPGADGVPTALGKFLSVANNPFATTVLRGMASNAMTQGISVAVGLQDKFDWRGVAMAGAGAAASFGMGELLSTNFGITGSSTESLPSRLFYNTATGMAGGVARAVVSGSRPNWAAIAADSFGQAVGSALGDSIVGSIQKGDQQRAQTQQESGYVSKPLTQGDIDGFLSGLDDIPGANPSPGAIRDAKGMTFSENSKYRAALQAQGINPDAPVTDAPVTQGIQGKYVKVKSGDTVSGLMGSSSPQAVGAFLAGNDMTNSNLRVGQMVFVPDDVNAFGAQGRLGQSTLNSDNRRLVIAAQASAATAQNAGALVISPELAAFGTGASFSDGRGWQLPVSSGSAEAGGLRTLGPALVAGWDTQQRINYKNSIQLSSVSGVEAVRAAAAYDVRDASLAYEAAYDASTSRNTARAMTRESLSWGGAKLSEAIDKTLPPEGYFSKAAGLMPTDAGTPDPFEVAKTVAQKSGSSRGSMTLLMGVGKVGGVVGTGYGAYAVASSIYNAPPEMRAQVATTEGGGVVMGAAGATLGTGLVVFGTTALVSNPAGWLVLGAGFVGSIGGGYLGTTGGQAAGKNIYQWLKK